MPVCPFPTCDEDQAHGHGTAITYEGDDPKPGSLEKLMRDAFDAGIMFEAKRQLLGEPASPELCKVGYQNWRRKMLPD